MLSRKNAAPANCNLRHKTRVESGSGIIAGIFHVDETCCCVGRRQMLRVRRKKYLGGWGQESGNLIYPAAWLMKFPEETSSIANLLRPRGCTNWLTFDIYGSRRARAHDVTHSPTSFSPRGESLPYAYWMKPSWVARAKSFWCVAKCEEILHRHQRTPANPYRRQIASGSRRSLPIYWQPKIDPDTQKHNTELICGPNLLSVGKRDQNIRISHKLVFEILFYRIN